MTQSNLFTSTDFYPTPDHLIEKMIGKVRMDRIDSILEPSAGKGNIVDFIRKRYDSEYRSSGNKSIDVIEIDPELQLILKGKNYRLIHDDFLTFHSRKNYDLIIANFPFSNGEDHLAFALQYLIENGGQLVCLVNAETIRNVNTLKRNGIVHRLRVNRKHKITIPFDQADQIAPASDTPFMVESEKAYCFMINEIKIWIPKSQIDDFHYRFNDHESHIEFYCPEWLITEKSLEYFIDTSHEPGLFDE